MTGDTRRAVRGGLPRAADVLLASVGLALTAPLLVLAAVAIKLDARGPVLYRSRRVGLAGAEFDLLKLRTMHPGSDPVGVGILGDQLVDVDVADLVHDGDEVIDAVGIDRDTEASLRLASP